MFCTNFAKIGQKDTIFIKRPKNVQMSESFFWQTGNPETRKTRKEDAPRSKLGRILKKV
jgi:hypothetical protein